MGIAVPATGAATVSVYSTTLPPGHRSARVRVCGLPHADDIRTVDGRLGVIWRLPDHGLVICRVSDPRHKVGLNHVSQAIHSRFGPAVVSEVGGVLLTVG